jgi:GlcNAc-P-P-Und epimerase
MDKVLVTGGSGFIGYHFHRFIEEGTIVNLDLVPPTFFCKSKYVRGDVREPNSVNGILAEHQCDAIICLAAEHRDFGVGKDAYFKTNEYGTKVICGAAAKHGIKKIVFFSSVAVYGSTVTITTEETLPAPASPYGGSKLAGEAVLRCWADEDSTRSVVILRPAVIFGVHNLANMLRLIIQIDKNRYANIGAADNIKSMAYVDNVVQAARFLMEKMRPGVAVFNYADEPQLCVRETVGIIAEALGKMRPFSVPYPLAYLMGLPFDLAIKLTGRDLPISTMRIKKICTATHHNAAKVLQAGFQPQWSTVEGLRKMVAWYVEEKRAGNPPVVGGSSGG